MPVEATTARIASLYRYPVKGMSGERLDRVSLFPGGTFPMDRAYALENGPSGFDPAAPAWQPKIKFLCLMRNARIASLHTRYDDANGVFSIARNGQTLAEARLDDASERAKIEQFFQEFMGNEARGKIRLLEAPAALASEASGQRGNIQRHSFSDVAKKVVSIINLDSVAALADSIKQPVHPLRFRGNIYVEGWPAWSEAGLVDRTLEIGAVRLRAIKLIQRCAATQVDPDTAERDIDVPEALYRLTGEDDCGIYAEVLTPGEIADRDRIVISR